MPRRFRNLKVAMIVGTRPQFVKASMLVKVLRRYQDLQILIIHTGQHYDKNMSAVFFRELHISHPKYNLGIGSSTHGVQTARMLASIERVLLKERPGLVVVFGDTNSTLAAALAAAKLKYRTKGLNGKAYCYPLILHVEAGLRSYKKRMPEEINRTLTDHICDIHFCPSSWAVENLKREGIVKNVYNVGDIMYDSLLYFIKRVADKQDSLTKFALLPRQYYLATIHREENTDVLENLQKIIDILENLDLPVLFPIHPRTKKAIKGLDIKFSNIRLISPLSYLSMLVAEKDARLIITDSGGVQKEAFYLKVPCIVLRDESEWRELLATGCNLLAGLNKKRVLKAVAKLTKLKHYSGKRKFYGDGSASIKMARIIRGLSKWEE